MSDDRLAPTRWVAPSSGSQYDSGAIGAAERILLRGPKAGRHCAPRQRDVPHFPTRSNQTLSSPSDPPNMTSELDRAAHLRAKCSTRTGETTTRVDMPCGGRRVAQARVRLKGRQTGGGRDRDGRGAAGGSRKPGGGGLASGEQTRGAGGAAASRRGHGPLSTSRGRWVHILEHPPTSSANGQTADGMGACTHIGPKCPRRRRHRLREGFGGGDGEEPGKGGVLLTRRRRGAGIAGRGRRRPRRLHVSATVW